MKRQTNYNLEFLRFIATIGVVFVHVGVCWIAAYGKSASSLANYIFSTIQHCMMWAVPVFMMITGCLMMRKEELSYRTAFRYFKRIGLLVVMFGTAFAWLELVFINHSISPDIIWKGIINMLQGETWEHLWYLYMLLGIYLILPLLHAYKRITPPISLLRQLLILTALIILFAALLPSIHLKLGINFPLSSVYVGYFLMGYILTLNVTKEYAAKKFCSWQCWLLLAATFGGIALGCGTEGIANYFDFASYTSIVVVLQATLIFHLATMQSGVFDNFCKTLLIRRFNRCSLGIYLVHMVWINIIIKVLHVNIMSYDGYLIVPMGLCVILLSWLTTECLVRLPYLRNVL